MISQKEIIEKSIRLVDKRGALLKPENVSGHVQKAELESFIILYTTPFSGAELLPGQLFYGIDIWHHNKKVFSVYFDDLSDEKLLGSKRQAWVKEFMVINETH